MLTGNLYSVTVICVQENAGVEMSCRIVYKEGENLTVDRFSTPIPSHHLITLLSSYPNLEVCLL